MSRTGTAVADPADGASGAEPPRRLRDRLGPAGRAKPAGRVGETGALRAVAPEARRFLRGRGRTLARLGGWSLLESAQAFLGGYGVARALDDGFLAGRTGTGLLWLGLAAAAALLGGAALRGVFGALADLVEPLRDGLVRRAVNRALDAAVADPARVDARAVSRVTQQCEMARDSFAGLVLTARSFLFTAAGALLGLAALAPLLLAVVLPPLLLGLGLFMATLAPMARVQRAFLDADEELSAGTATVAAGLRDIAACGGRERAGADVLAAVAAAERHSRTLARWASVRTLALGLAGRSPVAALLAATPWLLDSGLTAGTLVGALTYLMQSLLPALHQLMTALGAAGTRLLVVLERFCAPGPALPGGATPEPVPTTGPTAGHPVVGHPTTGQPAAVTATTGRAAVEVPAAELRAVRFAYGPRARPVLEGLDLGIRSGEHLAVVGPSGAGKSTLAALLAGVLAPGAGSVLVAGTPARRPGRGGPGGTGYGPDPRRTLLPQQAYVFTGTVRENLLHFHPEAGDAEVERSVEALGAGGLVARLGGPDAPLEPARLSQGERQLLALTAAHLSPAPLLLLDEATCHLDPDTEARAERALAARPGTLVVVAHRISSAARADRVLVLDGTTAVCGTHEELPARSPLYRELVGLWDTRTGADGPDEP